MQVHEVCAVSCSCYSTYTLCITQCKQTVRHNLGSVCSEDWRTPTGRDENRLGERQHTPYSCCPCFAYSCDSRCCTISALSAPSISDSTRSMVGPSAASSASRMVSNTLELALRKSITLASLMHTCKSQYNLMRLQCYVSRRKQASRTPTQKQLPCQFMMPASGRRWNDDHDAEPLMIISSMTVHQASQFTFKEFSVLTTITLHHLIMACHASKLPEYTADMSCAPSCRRQD
jgi:hypothetical protein